MPKITSLSLIQLLAMEAFRVLRLRGGGSGSLCTVLRFIGSQYPSLPPNKQGSERSF